MKKCVCYGMSGSCSERACWRVMPKFLTVSRILKLKYTKAVRMEVKSRTEARGLVQELVKG